MGFLLLIFSQLERITVEKLQLTVLLDKVLRDGPLLRLVRGVLETILFPVSLLPVITTMEMERSGELMKRAVLLLVDMPLECCEQRAQIFNGFQPLLHASCCRSRRMGYLVASSKTTPDGVLKEDGLQVRMEFLQTRVNQRRIINDRGTANEGVGGLSVQTSAQWLLSDFRKLYLLEVKKAENTSYFHCGPRKMPLDWRK